MSWISNFAKNNVCIISAALMICASSAAFATSAQIEVADPVLPIPVGKAANGNAFYGAVLGGHLYNSAGSIGGAFPLGKIGQGKLYFWGDIFTWVENPSATQFKPKRIMYTFEPGYNYVDGKNEIRFFLKHQSYHDPDTLNLFNESYELYGINYRWLGRPEYQLRAGYYLNESYVDYKWDLSASATFYMSKSPAKDTYLHLWVHHVTESGERSGFTDYAAELGMTIQDGLKLFGRYEYLHDMNRFGGTSDHHFVLGPKYTW